MNRTETALDRMKFHIETIGRELDSLQKYLDQEQNDVLNANWADVGTIAHIAAELMQIRKFWDNSIDEEN